MTPETLPAKRHLGRGLLLCLWPISLLPTGLLAQPILVLPLFHVTALSRGFFVGRLPIPHHLTGGA